MIPNPSRFSSAKDVGSNTQNKVPDTAPVTGTPVTPIDWRADTDIEQPENEVLVADSTAHDIDSIVLGNGMRTGS